MTDGEILALKRRQLAQMAAHRDALREHPVLHWVFFELTSRCNLACAHCGSSCTGRGESLTREDVRGVLAGLAEEPRPLVCLTGGEPLLHPDFFGIGRMVTDMGFLWGITTNATLIDGAAARRLREAGLGSVSVSLDGPAASHDALRRRSGAWDAAVRGLRCLRDAGLDPQVTTVVHRGNIAQLEELYSFLAAEGIRSWRIINVEPMGRACESEDLLLTPAEFRAMLAYIRGKRFDPACPMEVTYGCSHYLGAAAERMVRDRYFLCGAGIHVASVRANGDICACLDVANLPELVQGNIHRDSFRQVWRDGFRAFREDRTAQSDTCRGCPDRQLCGGDAAHTWDWRRREPLLCGLRMMEAPEDASPAGEAPEMPLFPEKP